MKKRQIALMTAATTILSSVCLTADAANAEVLIFDGERTALISSFGRINYNGENYVTFKIFPMRWRRSATKAATSILRDRSNGTMRCRPAVRRSDSRASTKKLPPR